MATVGTIDRFLDINAEHFTASMANALINFTVTDEVKQRAEELAEKSNFGTITTEEKDEYLRIIDLAEMMSLFQAKARRFLEAKA